MASQLRDQQPERVSGPGSLLYVVYAATHEAATQEHYDRQNRGAYKPIPGVTDAAYPDAELRRQFNEYPDDADLRALSSPL